MKNKLILMLKTLFASKGFSQKTLEGLAEIVAPNLTEESTDDEIKTAITGVEPYANLMQSEVTRVANEVANKPKPVEAPKPVTPVVDPAKPVEDMPEWAKALVESTKALAQGLEAISTEKVTNTRREQYAKTLENTSDAFKAKALKDFDRMKFDTDDQFSDFLTESAEDAKGFAQTEANDGLGGFRPTGGFGKAKTGEKEVSPEMKELIAERTAKAEAKSAQTI